MTDRKFTMPYLCLQATREGQASYAHVHEIATGLREAGMSVEVFEPAYHETSPGAVARMLEFLRVQREMRPALRNADAVYIRAHFAAFPTARRARVRVVQEVNGPYEDLFIAWPATRRLAPLFRWLMRWQYRNADVLITVTDGLRDWLAAETGRTDVHVIPNGANTDLFLPGLPPLEGMPERYAVFFGALAPWQGVEYALAAVSEPAWPKGVSLVIAGDGAARPAVEAAAAAEPRIVYAGVVPYHDVPRLVGNAVCGLSPQVESGRSASGLSPLKVYETLACGVPVVATDFPGVADFVRGSDAGLVVPSANAAAIAGAVATLAGDEPTARAMGARGREVVAASHSWAARARQTFEAITGGRDA